MPYTVTAAHVHPKWRLESQEFAVQEDGEFGPFRVGGDLANGYYAVAPGFGCSKTKPSARAAIRELLMDNGCYHVLINGGL